jgi:hypothetical protein
MSPEMLAVATLAVTLVVALLVDRGAPNILESIAFGLESAAGWTVAGLRRSAAALRKRQRTIERAHRERMAGARRRKPSYDNVDAATVDDVATIDAATIDAAVSSGSSSAPA